MATKEGLLYRVTDKATQTTRLVNAISNTQALNHVVAEAYDVAKASPKDVAFLLGSGVQIEDAVTPPSPAAGLGTVAALGEPAAGQVMQA